MTEEECKARLKDTKFFVEADSYAYFSLWRENSLAAYRMGERHGDEVKEGKPHRLRREWEQLNPGWTFDLGEMGGMRININVFWYRIDGVLVAFCDASAQNHRKTQAWYDKHAGKWDHGSRQAVANASNFHHCMHAIDEILGKSR